MKITPKELRQIIKEEYEQVISEGRYRQATSDPELYDALKDAIGNHTEYRVFGVLRGVFDDRAAARKTGKLNEDGHTDVPSAIRKLKTSMEDAMEILNALEQMPDTELPSWWMSKVTLAADYLNKSRDYLLVSEKLDPSDGAGAYVKDFRKSDAPQFKGKGKKKRQQMAVAAYLQDKEEGK
jgi:hypothetical protein